MKIATSSRNVPTHAMLTQVEAELPRSFRQRTLSRCAFGTLACLVALALGRPAQAQLRVVNYNIAQLNGNLIALENVIAALSDDDKPGFAVPVSVFCFQEVQSADLMPLLNIVNDAAPEGVSYVAATYTNEDKDGAAGAQALFYRSDMLQENPVLHVDLYTGGGRFTDRWRLNLIGYSSPVAGFYIYSSHLKANPGTADQQERLQGVMTIRANADLLGGGQHTIYCGDMNFYNNNEAGYQHFLSAGNGQAFDPLGTGSWAGAANAIKHSQSPRLTSGVLVGGGLDDRFDFQLSTAGFGDNTGLSRIANTYRSVGNDGNHYNIAINTGTNSYYPWDIPASDALADYIYDASDHVPLMVDYQIPAVMAADMDADYGRVLQGTPYQIAVDVTNVAEVDHVIGADELNYNAVASQGLSGSATDSVLALGDVSSPSFALDTSVVGPRTGQVVLTSSSQGVQNPSMTLNTTGTIVRHANPSFSSSSDLDQLSVPQQYDANTGVQTISVDVHNFGFDSLQALMDVDSVSSLAAPFGFAGGLAANIGAVPATLNFTFDTAGLSPGKYAANITINASDENLPGEATAQLALTLSITIEGAETCAADVDGNGMVDIDDLFAVIAAWGPCPVGPEPCPADVNDTGEVDIDDLFIVIAAWGAC